MILIILILIIVALSALIYLQNKKIKEAPENLSTGEVKSFIEMYWPKVRQALSVLAGVGLAFGVIGFDESIIDMILTEGDNIVAGILVITSAIGAIIANFGTSDV